MSNSQSNTKKLTRLEKNWILYDVANSAFILLQTSVASIAFLEMARKANISETDGLAYWGYATFLATLIIMIGSLIVGRLGDRPGRKKLFFKYFMYLGVGSCVLMGLQSAWLAYLFFFVITRIGFNGSLIFYDAMLPDITEEDRMELVSAHGFAWGYIGSCIPFIAVLIIIFKAEALGLTVSHAIAVGFILTAIWWYVFSIPLLRTYKQKHAHKLEGSKFSVSAIFSDIKKTLVEIKSNKQVLWFLIAYFFYIDGVQTIILMATVYASSLGLDSNNILMALLITQFVAFPSAIIYGKLAKKHGPNLMIKIAIVAYAILTVYAIWLDSSTKFFIMAIWVGLFQGGIQSLSRTYYARIIPHEKSSEYFAVYDIFAKGADFLGVLIISVATQLFGDQTKAIGIIVIFFIVGYLAFVKANKYVKD